MEKRPARGKLYDQRIEPTLVGYRFHLVIEGVLGDGMEGSSGKRRA